MGLHDSGACRNGSHLSWCAQGLTRRNTQISERLNQELDAVFLRSGQNLASGGCRRKLPLASGSQPEKLANALCKSPAVRWNRGGSCCSGRENGGTELYYYRARYYSPTLQRFVSQDPIGFAGGDPNIYAYVGNDAVNRPDPEGLWTAAVGWTFGGGAGWGGGSITLGFAIDDSGHLAFFGTGAGGAGLGANTYSGLSASVSNAPCVTDLGGPFGNQSFGAGLGLDTNIDVYEGRAASNGQNIVGWGLTVGEGLGAGGLVGGSKTVIIPLGTL